MKNIPPPLTHETIAARARQLWEEAGRPAGRDEEFWLRAEQELRAEAAEPSVPPLLPVPRTTSPPPVLQAPATAVPPIIRGAVTPGRRTGVKYSS